MPDFALFLPLLSLTIALLAAVGVVIAFVGNKNRGLSEVQSSTITALQAQNSAQAQQILSLEKKIARLENVLRTIQITLSKRRHLRLEIDDETVTIVDERTGSELTVPLPLPGSDQEREKKGEG